MRHDMMIVAAKLDQALDAGPLGERHEVRHALDLHLLPESVLVGITREMADVITGGKHDRIEGSEIRLGEGAFSVVPNQDGKARQRGRAIDGLARSKRDVIALFLQKQCGVSTDHSGAANNKNLHVYSSCLPSIRSRPGSR